MEDHLIAEILKSPGDVKAAMQIAFGRKQLESTLLKKLVAELAGASDGETWRVDASEANNGLLARQWKGISVHFSDQLDCHFRLQFDESGYSSAIYGVAKKDEFSKVHETREARLAEYGPGILSDASWYWYRKLNVNDDKMPFEADWNSNAEPWSEIASGTFADKLISVAKDLRVVLLSTL